ncbi:hypothetical protein TRFO_28570 [Tritrichomonas foetus]|uniref:BEACH domain-containing protein n=1 Tax=Tritrichomonas foetus TaxID=1144522 RepID=A0A1J4JZA6_9EUKA|nr:hypothetical protein TRFO_28570 [Tritrichomonas foetus]|eukprot:OHT04026.1 hypothetical protein TRFO_28570 [Tritrichomonas foetus]
MRDPFISILKLKIKVIPDYHAHIKDPNLISLFDLHKIPHFSAKEIFIIKTSLKSHNNHSDSIKKINKTLVPFVPKPLISLSEYQISDQPTLEYIHAYILSSYVSWINFHEHTDTIECLIDLLMILNFLHDSKYADIGKDCFIYAFNIYRNNKIFPDLSRYITQFITFFRNFNNFTVEDYSLLADFFNDVCTLPDNQFLFILMNSLKPVFERHGNEIPVNIYERFMNDIFPYVTDLTPVGIQFYKMIITHLNQKQAKETVSTIILVICKDILTLKQIPTFPPFEGSFSIIQSSFIPPADFPSITTFENGFNIIDNSAKVELPAFETLYNTELMDKILPFFKAISKSKVSSLEAVEKMGEFINRMAQTQSKYSLYIVFLALISKVLRHLLNHVSFTSLLFKKEIFNPAVICTGKNLMDQSIINMNILRSEAFKNILYDGANETSIVLNSFIDTPPMFLELIQRCIDNYDKMTINVLESCSFIEFISNALTFYQNLRYKNEKVAEEISIKLYFFISLICQEEKAKYSLFNNIYFCNIFVSQSYEENLRKFVFTQIKLAYQSECLPRAFLKLFESLFRKFPSAKSTQLANELLILINDIIVLQRSNAESYSIIAEPLFESLSMLDQSPGSSNLLSSVLKFFTETVFDLDDHQYNKFSTAIRTIYGNEDHDLIFKRLVQFLAGDSISTVNPSFIIRRPRAVLIFFYMYSKSQKIITFLIELCKFSDENCKACHQSRFDILILETIKSIWSDSTTDRHYLELLFNLLSIISSGQCSIAVVEKYISLLSPIGGQYLSPHIQIATDTLYDIIRSGLRIPSYQMPFQRDNQIKPQEIFSLIGGFTFVAWLYISKSLSNYRPMIFKIWNDKNWSLTISVNLNVISFLELGPNYKIPSNMDAFLPTNEWIKLGLTYYIDQKSASLLLYINSVHVTTLKTVVPDILDWNFHFCFGGVTEASTENDVKPSYIGPFSLYPILDNDQVAAVFNDNPNSFSPLERKPLFSYFPSTINTFEKSTFYSLFVGKDCLKLILPMFSMSYLTFIDGEKYKLLFESAISIISNTLSGYEEAEKGFLYNKGFEILSYLLTHANSIYLTYHLYTKICQIFQSLQNYHLQVKLFTSILVNISVWLTSNDQIPILKHILRTLIPSFPNLTKKFLSYQIVLNTLITFYSNQHPNKKTQKISHLQVCRNILYRMLTLPTYIEFKYLLSAIIQVDDNEIAKELLELLMNYSESTSLKPFFERNCIKNFFTKLCFDKINQIPHLVIDILVNFHTKSIIHISEYVDIILSQFSPKSASVELFDLLISLINQGYIEFFSFFCYVGVQLDVSEAKKINKIKTTNIINIENWYFCPVIWALSFVPEWQYVIMNFLAITDPNQWIPICTTIYHLSNLQNKNASDSINCYLMQISHFLICEEICINKKNFKDYQFLIGHYIFFHKYDQTFINFNLDIYETVDIMNDISNEKPQPEISLKGISSSYIKRLFLGSTNDKEKRFGLRISENMTWKDYELAKAFIFIFSKKQSYRDYDLYAIVYHFYSRIDLIENDFIVNFECIVQNDLNENQKLITKPYTDITSFVENVFIKKYLKTFLPSFMNIIDDDFVFNDTYKKSIVHDYRISNFKFIKHLRKQEKSYQNSWLKLWSELTQDGRPWESASHKISQYIRDMTLCGDGFPYKIKKVWRFEEKMSASIVSEIIYGANQYSDWNQEEQIDYHNNNKVLLIDSPCQIIKSNIIYKESEILVYKKIFILRNSKQKIMNISSIISMIQQSYHSKQLAFEIYLKDGKSFILVFPSTNHRDHIFDSIFSQIHIHSKFHPFIIRSGQPVPPEFIDDWREHKISNFKYIHILNQISSCSFHNEKQYPIFPRILEDFSDINSIRTFQQTIQYSDKTPFFYLKKVDQFQNSSINSFTHISQVTKEHELPPEFFFLPEIFETNEIQTFILPNWANSSFDFVYQCRKILESEQISENLNKWFDQIWGDFRVKYCMYLPLFDSPHPSRLPLPNTYDYSKTINIEESEKTEETSHSEFIICESLNWIAFFNTISSPSLSNLDVTTDNTYNIILKHKIEKVSNSIEFSFNDKIICSFISEEFHTIVIGMSNGTIFVHSLERSSPVFIINLCDEFAQAISISPSWGLIVVFTNKQRLILYNINGLLIKKIQTNSSIEKIFCWSNNEGFDFMATVTNIGDVIINEVYYATFKDYNYHCDKKVVDMSFSEKDQKLVLYTTHDCQKNKYISQFTMSNSKI